ncbi:hypothetical protein [Cloacibacillus sp. An23]|uniref:hypothetical protein n=1 Tax=Cloacibacillus sp. An23 TaxID=1965591 RepID=UPI000B37A859|nr:hypothetical protein [Cloacibacillus sp. An23]OUO93470.1 hypothetical protein B5F39_07150 [Cloacibacillus sp. An23]
MDIDEFLLEIKQIDWFGHEKDHNGEYHMIFSVFEAYDVWNSQMLKTWEPHILSLESTATERIGDAQIDEVFSRVSSGIGDAVWKKWCDFITKRHLEDEAGLENEMLDMVKRDMSWACIEKILNAPGFFCALLEIYKNGYFPCAWIGDYPLGKAVVL